MVVIPSVTHSAAPEVLTLEKFLLLPETKPAQEYINGQISQKSMPKGRHSRLQSKLSAVINQITEDSKIAYAFTELRCSFGGRSLVPDIAVFLWESIPFLADGEVPDRFNLPPDWVIEICSPDQSSNKIIKNILYCLDHGTQLGWLIDPEDSSILILLPNQKPLLKEGKDILPILESIDLNIQVDQIFNWLNMA
jgi:Uma2 family endonuclease